MCKNVAVRCHKGSVDYIDGFQDQVKRGKKMSKFENDSRRLTRSMALLLVALAAGCGGGGGDGGRDPILGTGAGSTVDPVAALAAAAAAAAAAGLPPPVGCAAGALDLGSAVNFGVLAGTALTITNPTSVTGDVGSPSITPASGPSTLVGTQFDTSTGSLPLIAAAVADLNTAISCAVARACDFSYGAPKDFGGTTLAPGVHCVTGAMSVGSNLTLSTPGVYIFRATGALTSAPTITVAYGGSANAANSPVFWVSSGAAGGASIGATNVFLGTIMVNAPGAVTLGATTTLLPGRVLSATAATLDTNTIARP